MRRVAKVTVTPALGNALACRDPGRARAAIESIAAVHPGASLEPMALGYPTKVRPSRRAQDARTAAKLWEVSEALTGVRYGGLAR